MTASAMGHGLRGRFRVYRAAVWRGGVPGGTFRTDGPAPERPFAIVTAAFPRKRAALHPSADDEANAKLAKRIRAAGFEAIACVGADSSGPHIEPSFWVWDVEAREAIEWGREFDQHAVVTGDGARHSILTCFPEDEPPDPPDVALLLHGMGGTGEGSVKLLEGALRSKGWTTTRFLRPTIGPVQERQDLPDLLPRSKDTVAAWLREKNEAPMLTVGLSFGGLLAGLGEAPWRIGVAAPWAMLSGVDRTRLGSWPGMSAIHGLADEEVPSKENLAALPETVARDVDPKGTHDFDSWVDRIATRVMARWADAR